MFVKPLSAYPFLGAMYPSCPVCKQAYEREPGFYTGAMYFGYGFSVATFLACGLSVYVLGNDPATWVYITTTIVAAFVQAPLNFRYSRVLMLHIFGDVTFDPAYKEASKEGEKI